jgi:hypothetical protein
MSFRCKNPFEGLTFRKVGRNIWDTGMILIAPIFSVPTFFIFLWSLTWSGLVVRFDYFRNQAYESITMPFTILTTTLAFILPLQAQAAVARNKASLDNYSAFCGDVLALGWEVIAFARDEEQQTNNVSEKNKEKIEDIFDILFVIPTAVKWNFRNSNKLDIDKLDLVKKKNGKYVTDPNLDFYGGEMNPLRRRRGSRVNELKLVQKFKQTRSGQSLMRLEDNMLGVGLCELMFAKIYDLIAEVEASDTRKNMLTRTAERIYGSYGNIGNINSFTLPRLYDSFLRITLLVFVTLLPFSYGKDGNGIYILGQIQYNIMWHAFVIIYFFLGIDSVTKTVGDAFVSSSGATGFQTVGQTESNTNKALHAMFAHKVKLQTTISLTSLDANFEDSQGKFRRLIHY